jgi:hypothetical protein
VRIRTALLDVRILELKHIRHVQIVVCKRRPVRNDILDQRPVFLVEIDLFIPQKLAYNAYT